MNTETSAQQIIDVNDSSELDTWSTLLGVTEEQLKDAVAQVGKLVENVEPYLRRNEIVAAEAAKHVANVAYEVKTRIEA